MFNLDKKLISWAQYLQWANVNFDRYICDDENSTTEEIAKALQWFASEYVVIEGWLEIKAANDKVNQIIKDNDGSIDLLRRARNAVFHYQKAPLDNRLIEFAKDFDKSGWLIDLHQAFMEYLLNYPSVVYPYNERKEEFIEKYFEIIGWKPCLIKNT